MTNRQLQCAVTLVVLAAVAGCKNTSKIAQSTPAATPTPVASAQKLPGTKSPPSPSSTATPTPNQTLVASFKINPPVSFASDQIPQGGLSEFTLQGGGGQYLRVEVDEEINRRVAQPSVSVQLQGNDSGLAPMTPDFCDDRTYALQETGIYRVVFDPAGQKSTIRFTLLDRTDPLLVSGLNPEQVSIDLGVFAKGKTITAEPYELTCEVGESWPGHLLVKGTGVALTIMQVAGYRELFRHDSSMSRLLASLSPGGKPVEAKKLPYASCCDAATVMSARPALLKGEGWRGWRWIEGQSQDLDYPGGLTYSFEGITDDNRFFFRMSALISHPDLQRLLPHTDQLPDEDSMNKQSTASRLQLEKSLAAADPASFQPNLDQLDAVIRSLKLRQ